VSYGTTRNVQLLVVVHRSTDVGVVTNTLSSARSHLSFEHLTVERADQAYHTLSSKAYTRWINSLVPNTGRNSATILDST
jgi:hypothetical protein